MVCLCCARAGDHGLLKRRRVSAQFDFRRPRVAAQRHRLSVISGFPRYTFGFYPVVGRHSHRGRVCRPLPDDRSAGNGVRRRAQRNGVVIPANSPHKDDNAAQLRQSLRDTCRHTPTWTLAGLVGWLVGVIPGVGGVLANMLGYLVIRETSRDKTNFGKGDVRGLIGSEAANNGSVGGALVPALALGIPGSLNTAISARGVHDQRRSTRNQCIHRKSRCYLVDSVKRSPRHVAVIKHCHSGGWRLVSVIGRLRPVVLCR